MRKRLLYHILLSASPLIPRNLPLAERIKALSPFFSPPIGSQLAIDEEEEQGRQKLASPHLLRGYIKVSPPKGYCFIIQQDPARPDERVCKARVLTFTLADLDLQGQLHWSISTGPDDFGTPVSWQTPYRVGYVVDETMAWPGGSRSVLIKGCEAVKSEKVGRRIYIHLFHGKKWSVSFPSKDQLAPQPKKPKPNLFIQIDNYRTNPLEPKKKPGSASKAPSSPKKVNTLEENPNAIISKWQMHPRHAYTMRASHFIGSTSYPPGMGGECRYKYEEKPGDPHSGRLECHSVAHFKWLSLPLTCLSQLRPASPQETP